MNLVDKIFGMPGTLVPDSVWDCDDLKPTDIKLYKVLLDYGKLIHSLGNAKFTSDGAPIIKVSQQTLADKVKVSVKTVQTSLGRLLGVQLIQIDRYNGYKRNNHIVLDGTFFEPEKSGKKKELSTMAEKIEKAKEVVKGNKVGGTEHKPERTDKPVKAKAVKKEPVKRTPIKMPKPLSKHEQKLKDMGGMIHSDKEIVEMAQHYSMLASRVNHITHYRALSVKNPMDHKNWKHFVKLYNLCMEKDWNYKLYMDAQFERAKKYWTNNKIKYPLPGQMCSPNAQKYFAIYLEDRKEKYAQDVTKKDVTRGQRTIGLKQKFMEDIVQSAKSLSYQVFNDGSLKSSEDKTLQIFHHWAQYPPAYLWSIPWFRDYLAEAAPHNPDNEKMQDMLLVFNMINKSKPLQEIINRTARAAERQYNIPENMVI